MAIALAAMVMVMRQAKAADSRPRPLKRALWIWNTAELLQDDAARRAMLTFCKDNHIDRILIQLIYSMSRDAGGNPQCSFSDEAKLRELVRESSTAGVEVCGLDGSPEAVLTRNQADVIAMVDAVIAYNRRVEAPERLHGIHLDNEPYSLPAFQSPQRIDLLRQMVQLTARVAAMLKAQAPPLSLEVDVPFWIDDSPGAHDDFMVDYAGIRKNAGEYLTDLAQDVMLMDYRVEAGGPNGVIEHARNAIAYANQAHRNLYIGVETTTQPPAPVVFSCMVDEARWKDLANDPSSFLFRNRFEGYPIRVVRAGSRVWIGVAQASFGPRPTQEIHAAAVNLCKSVAAAGLPQDQVTGDDALKNALREHPEFTELQPSAAGPEAGWGFTVVENFPASITWAGRNMHQMEAVLGEVAAAFQDDPAFAGFAIHDYRGLRALAR